MNPTIPLELDCQLQGYNNKEEERISHTTSFQLDIDGHQLEDTPFLIADTGKHDMILGKKWLQEHDIWLDSSNE